MKKINVGIIGGTNGMGKWFAGLLKKEGCRVYVCGRKTRLQINDLAGLCDVVVVAVPISATPEIIGQVGPQLTKDQLLMDLTSLKKEPVTLMRKTSQAEVIGCHPLFGPQLKDVSGQNVILCPARGKKWLGWLKGVFKRNKMAVWESTPEKHDRMMAVVQALNHLDTMVLGLAIARTGMAFADIDKFSTPIFRIKMEMIRKVFMESPELYRDIVRGNPQTDKMLNIYEKALKDIRAVIRTRGKKESTEFVTKVAAKVHGRKN